MHFQLKSGLDDPQVLARSTAYQGAAALQGI
jgi:hypothetical protein